MSSSLIVSEVVAANQQPDFRTICRFRAEHEKALEELFVAGKGVQQGAGRVSAPCA